MPLQRDHLQLLILILSVPVQYYVVQKMGSTEATRSYAISKLVDQINEIQQNWLKLEPWKKWCQSVLQIWNDDRSYATNPSYEEYGESPAYEVMKHREGEGHFGRSTRVRDRKSPHVQYRVGQVIKHKLWGYHGVIVGWDETANAPESWIKEMHGSNHHWRHQPNYSVLVDTRDRPDAQTTYVPQENIEVVSHTQVLHPQVDNFFETFDGSQYLPRPWLKALYPRD